MKAWAAAGAVLLVAAAGATAWGLQFQATNYCAGPSLEACLISYHDAIVGGWTALAIAIVAVAGFFWFGREPQTS